MNIPESITNANFFTGGKAVFTVDNGRVGNEHRRYTFKIVKKELPRGEGRQQMYFAYILTGPDNMGDYTYLGVVDPFKLTCRPSRKSKFERGSEPFVAINWAMRMVAEGRQAPGDSLIIHEGRCARCGRRLTVPESVKSGFGPECASRL